MDSGGASVPSRVVTDSAVSVPIQETGRVNLAHYLYNGVYFMTFYSTWLIVNLSSFLCGVGGGGGSGLG